MQREKGEEENGAEKEGGWGIFFRITEAGGLP